MRRYTIFLDRRTQNYKRLYLSESRNLAKFLSRLKKILLIINSSQSSSGKMDVKIKPRNLSFSHHTVLGQTKVGGQRRCAGREFILQGA